MRSLIRLLGVARELWPYYVGIAAASVATAALALLPVHIKVPPTRWRADPGRGRRPGPDLLAVALLVVELLGTVVRTSAATRRRHDDPPQGDPVVALLRQDAELPQRYLLEPTGTIINRLTRSITTTQFLQMFSNSFFPMLLTVIAVGHHGAVLLGSAVARDHLPSHVADRPHVEALAADRAAEEHRSIAGGRFAEAIGQIRRRSFTSNASWRADRHYGRTIGLTQQQSRLHLAGPSRRLNLILRRVRDHLHVDGVRCVHAGRDGR